MWVSVTSVWSAVRSAVRGRPSKATNAEVRGKIRGQVPRPSFVDSADSERGQLGAKKGVKKSTRVVFDTKTKATAGYSQTTARTRASSHHHSTFSDSHGVEFLAHIANLSPLLSPTPNSFSAPPSRRLFLAFPKPRGLPKCSHSIPLPRPKR